MNVRKKFNQKIRTVLDTNIFVAAYFNKKSYSAQILKLAAEKNLAVFWNKKIKRELYIILRNIHADRNFYSFVDLIFRSENFIQRTPRVDVIKVDYSDNQFLGLCLAAKADYLISSDYHLLKIGKFKSTKILRPKDFIKTYFSSLDRK